MARPYVLALERGHAGERYHAVAKGGISARRIAEVVGAGLGVPVRSIAADDAATMFGWFGLFAGMDLPASSVLTRQRLGWQPVGPTLLQDLQDMEYREGR